MIIYSLRQKLIAYTSFGKSNSILKQELDGSNNGSI